MKHANNQDGVMLWVKRDDEGNITDWEMTIKRDDLIKILSEVIDELKESGKQAAPASAWRKNDTQRQTKKEIKALFPGAALPALAAPGTRMTNNTTKIKDYMSNYILNQLESAIMTETRKGDAMT